jgi:tetraacyldisaccharide 4'-kinase
VTVAEALLWPASVLYGAAARLRAGAYNAGLLRQLRLRSTVVSVGNIITGGTGKTPMVLWIAQRLAESGKKVGILSRGYRPLPQDSGSGAAAKQGWNDEVALLHGRLGERAEIGVGANRFEKGRELEKRGVNCFVLDDGFQHLELARDVDIVMIDATNPFGGGRALPSGRLREPLSALSRAGVFVIHRTMERVPAIEAVIRRHSAAPIYFSQTKLLGWQSHRGSEGKEFPETGHKYFAFCGIGNPTAFFADLKNWGGIAVGGHHTFRDHHRYTQLDISNLQAEARGIGAAALVCTEKDIYDLPDPMTVSLPIFFCKIALQFNDEEGLWRSIVEAIERKNLERVE